MNKWDERYNKADFHYGTEPNDFLRDHAHTLLSSQSKPRVICLADGEGRNSVYLAQLGADVVALDISAVGLAKAEQLAGQRNTAITTQLADLGSVMLPNEAYDGVVMIFCHIPPSLRPNMYEQIRKSLKPGGWFLAECYTRAQLGRGTGGPASADLMVELAELEHEFSGFRIAHRAELVRLIHEGDGHTGAGAVCQFIALKQH